MFPHFGGGGASLPEIGHSLRFNSADSAYLSRTFGSPTNNTSWALSLWVKRTALTTLNPLFYASSAAVVFKSTDVLEFLDNGGASVATSTPVYRDPSAHGHLFVRSNGTNIKGYWNGTEVISYTGTITDLNSAVQHEIGRAGATYGNFNLSRICFVDNGGSLTPSDFAYTDPNGQWHTKSAGACKAVVDAGGTNSFMLEFDDGTSTTTLGNDYSAKNNDWTLTNFTRSAGVNDDWMEDTPTNNFCTWSVIDKHTSAATTDGSLSANSGGTVSMHRAIRGTIGITKKSYYEITLSGGTTGMINILGAFQSTANLVDNTYVGGVSKSFGNGYSTSTGLFYQNGVTQVHGASTPLVNGTWGIAIDPENGQAWLRDTSGNWIGGGDPAVGSYNTWSWTPDDLPWFPAISFYNVATSFMAALNCGQRAFAYTPPTGFKALCTKNLPAPSIVKPAQHHDIKLYTGNASTQAITGLLFPPGLVNLKSRGRAVDWAWYDQVRGVEKRLETNNTDAEVTGDTTGLTAFNSDGWTMGALDQINGTTATNSFVGFAWKANGAGVSNTDGSITSTVSANQIAGFSIVTYTGTGANATVGHGLGVAPKLVIVKQRSSGTTENWATWHTSIANTEYLLLNGTAAKAAGATYWNSASPTASVFSVGTSNDTNENTKEYVAYCFAEISGYSKFGSYTGNGSTDGPFMWCGFRPKYVLVKRTDSTGSWELYDAARGSKNPMGTTDLQADTAGAENASTISTGLDFLSNGFKGRDTTSYLNASSGTYIFAAFAEAPFKFANAR